VVWPELRPYFDRRGLSAAERFGLPTEPEELAGCADRDDVGRLAAALVRAGWTDTLGSDTRCQHSTRARRGRRSCVCA